MPPPFPNKYKKSLVKTEKDCWTCRKTCYTCLLTDNYSAGGDFLYTCEAHLKDRNFATPVEEPAKDAPAAPAISQAEIDAAVKEYQERKKAKEAKDKEGKPVDTEKKDKEEPINAPAHPPSVEPAAPVEPAYYELHKHFYEMRLRMHMQKKQQKEAQSRRAQLEFPSAPTSKPSQPKASS